MSIELKDRGGQTISSLEYTRGVFLSETRGFLSVTVPAEGVFDPIWSIPHDSFAVLRGGPWDDGGKPGIEINAPTYTSQGDSVVVTFSYKSSSDAESRTTLTKYIPFEGMSAGGEIAEYNGGYYIAGGSLFGAPVTRTGAFSLVSALPEHYTFDRITGKLKANSGDAGPLPETSAVDWNANDGLLPKTFQFWVNNKGIVRRTDDPQTLEIGRYGEFEASEGLTPFQDWMVTRAQVALGSTRRIWVTWNARDNVRPSILHAIVLGTGWHTLGEHEPTPPEASLTIGEEGKSRWVYIPEQHSENGALVHSPGPAPAPVSEPNQSLPYTVRWNRGWICHSNQTVSYSWIVYDHVEQRRLKNNEPLVVGRAYDIWTRPAVTYGERVW